jgi:hypothetical protein
MHEEDKKNQKVSIDFAIYLIYLLGKEYNRTAPEMYRVLDETKILDDYILHCYDTLHTLGNEYLVHDIGSFIEERGVKL